MAFSLHSLFCTVRTRGRGSGEKDMLHEYWTHSILCHRLFALARAISPFASTKAIIFLNSSCINRDRAVNRTTMLSETVHNHLIENAASSFGGHISLSYASVISVKGELMLRESISLRAVTLPRRTSSSFESRLICLNKVLGITRLSTVVLSSRASSTLWGNSN